MNVHCVIIVLLIYKVGKFLSFEYKSNLILDSAWYNCFFVTINLGLYSLNVYAFNIIAVDELNLW